METFSALLGPLWEESTGDREIPLRKSSDADFLCFFWTTEQTVQMPMIWDAMPLIVASLQRMHGWEQSSLSH